MESTYIEGEAGKTLMLHVKSATTSAFKAKFFIARHKCRNSAQVDFYSAKKDGSYSLSRAGSSRTFTSIGFHSESALYPLDAFNMLMSLGNFQAGVAYEIEKLWAILPTEANIMIRKLKLLIE